MSMTPASVCWLPCSMRNPTAYRCDRASNATSIKMKPFRQFKELAGIQAEERYLYDWPELGTALPDEQSLERPAQRCARRARLPAGAGLPAQPPAPAAFTLHR